MIEPGHTVRLNGRAHARLNASPKRGRQPTIIGTVTDVEPTKGGSQGFMRHKPHVVVMWHTPTGPVVERVHSNWLERAP